MSQIRGALGITLNKFFDFEEIDRKGGTRAMILDKITMLSLAFSILLIALNLLKS